MLKTGAGGRKFKRAWGKCLFEICDGRVDERAGHLGFGKTGRESERGRGGD